MGPPQSNNLCIERIEPFQRQPEVSLLLLFVLLNPMAVTVATVIVVVVAAIVVATEEWRLR
jgi:hypothetical protein